MSASVGHGIGRVDPCSVDFHDSLLELRIDSPNRVRFEARGSQQGAVTIRDLVRHALRHRPDHIVVGEVRGGEAADLLQALNTGHGGSLTTVHANNAESALSRLASCAMQGGGNLPWEVTCRSVVDGIAAPAAPSVGSPAASRCFPLKPTNTSPDNSGRVRLR